MNGCRAISGEVWRTAKVVLFQLFALFWLIKLAYVTKAYFSRGLTGARGVIVHGMPIPADPKVWGHAQWGLVILRYGTVALLTIALGFFSRRELKQWWLEIRSRRTVKPPDLT